MSSRGLKNNNPLNIRKSKEVFQGEKLPSTDPAFKQFVSMSYGYRAAFIILGTYISQGHNTIDKIVSKWAPPSENQTQQYILNVERRSGVNRSTLLFCNSGNEMIKIVAAMSFSENGVPASMPDVYAGFSLQTKFTR